MKLLFIAFLTIGIIIFSRTLFKSTPNKNAVPQPSPINSTSQDPNTSNSDIYVFSSITPSKTIKLSDDQDGDHRLMSVHIYDDRLARIDEPNNDYLVIKNTKDSNVNDYKFYSDVKLLHEMNNNTATLYRAVEKSLTIRYEGKKERYFKYYETEMNGKLLRKYLFDYAGIQYLIAVEFMKDKDIEFTELTNKILATIIPHTIAPDQIEKILQ